MLKKYRKLLIILICIALVFFYLIRKVNSVMYDSDELSWFFHTEFYEELFLRRDIKSTMWQSYESYDHPPVSKYFFGFGLNLFNRNFIMERDYLVSTYGRWSFYFNDKLDLSSHPIIRRNINIMRRVNVLFTCILLLTTGFIIFLFTRNLVFSGIFILLELSNNLFLKNTRALPDVQFLFFSYAALSIFLTNLNKKNMLRLFLSAIFMGLSVASKLTGIVIVITYLFYTFSEVVIYFKPRILRKEIIIFFTVLSCTFLTWVIVNPALYPAPVKNSIKYMNFRLIQTAKLQNYFPKSAILSVADKTEYTVCSLIIVCPYGTDEKAQVTQNNLVNLLVVLFALTGIIFTAINSLYTKNFMLLAIFSIMTVIFNFLLLPLRSDRYLIPNQMIYAIYISMGISVFLKKTKCLIPQIKNSA